MTEKREKVLQQDEQFLKNAYKKAVLPCILSMLSGNINILVDGILVGQKAGSNSLAAINLCVPVYLVLCVIGSYAIHRNMSDVVVMIIFGVLGYLMRKFDLNTAAVVLALILGPISEKGLRGALRVSGGDIGCLFQSPVSWVLIILSIIGIFSPFFMDKFERKVAGDENVDAAVQDETLS